MKKHIRALAILLASILVLSAGAVTVGASGVFLDLKRFIYCPTTTNNNSIPIEAEWGAALFEMPATAAEWNPGLLRMTSILANNAYFQQFNDERPWYYDPGKGDISQTLMKLGFETGSIQCYRPGEADGDIEHFNYVTFAQQTMNIGGTNYQMIAVMLRGTIDPEEWVSDFYVPSGDYAVGFRKAEQKVLEALLAYLAGQDNGLPRKLLITGHSRGAAVANLLAADLNGSEYTWVAPRENIYTYTFGTPNVAQKRIIGAEHSNIWNFVNPLDLVTYFPFEKWGYGKFGETVILPSDNQIEDEFVKYTGFPAGEANVGVNAAGISAFAGIFNQSYYNEKYGQLKPKIRDLFTFDQKTQIDLEKFDAKAEGIFDTLFGTNLSLQQAWKGLKASSLKNIVYQHTPETYVARAMSLVKPHIERTDNPETPIKLTYRGSATYELKGIAPGATVNWRVPDNPSFVEYQTNGSTVTVKSLKQKNKFKMILPFLGATSFTLQADDGINQSELKVNIEMPLVFRILFFIPVFGWITIGWIY